MQISDTVRYLVDQSREGAGAKPAAHALNSLRKVYSAIQLPSIIRAILDGFLYFKSGQNSCGRR